TSREPSGLMATWVFQNRGPRPPSVAIRWPSEAHQRLTVPSGVEDASQLPSELIATMLTGPSPTEMRARGRPSEERHSPTGRRGAHPRGARPLPIYVSTRLRATGRGAPGIPPRDVRRSDRGGDRSDR